jgi:hypothetical protein
LGAQLGNLTAAELNRRIDVQAIPGSTLISVSFEDRRRDFAKSVVGAVSAEYTGESASDDRDRAVPAPFGSSVIAIGPLKSKWIGPAGAIIGGTLAAAATARLPERARQA